MTITRCTLTGLDDPALISNVNILFKQFPFLEIGILHSTNLAGRDRRFPATDAVVEMIESLDCPVALHVCGSDVQNVLSTSREGSLRAGWRFTKRSAVCSST